MHDYYYCEDMNTDNEVIIQSHNKNTFAIRVSEDDETSVVFVKIEEIDKIITALNQIKNNSSFTF